MQYGSYGYGGYPAPSGYYPPPPVPDQLAQLRQQQQYQNFQPNMMQGNQMQNNMGMQGMNQPMMQQQPQTMPSENSNIIWVTSYKEAEDYLVANNAAVEMRDTNNQFLYVKQRDASGKPTIECYALTKVDIAQTAPQPVQAAQVPPVQYVTVEQFNALAARYDEMAAQLDALKTKRQQTKKSTKEETEE